MNQQAELDLDFIEQPFLSASNLSLTGLLCLLLGLIFVTFTWQAYLNQQSRLALNIIEFKQSNKQLKPAITLIAKPEMIIEPKEKLQIQQMVSALTIPWNDLLEGIEQVEMQNIVLLSLTPNLKKQQLQLTGEAKDLASALQYVKQLEMQPMLSQVYLQKHVVDTQNTAKQVSFSLSARWEIVNESSPNEPL